MYLRIISLILFYFSLVKIFSLALSSQTFWIEEPRLTHNMNLKIISDTVVTVEIIRF